MKLRSLLTFLVLLLSVSVLVAQTPLTPIFNLRGKTDSNGALYITNGVAVAPDTPLTTIANLRGKTDSNGALAVTCSSCSQVFKTILGTGIATEFLGTLSAAAGVFQTDGSVDFGLEFFSMGNHAYGLWNEFSKSRSTDGNTHAIVQNSDQLGLITFNGDDGVVLAKAATIEGAVDGTPGADDMPGRLSFSTSADGTVTPTERLRIANNGDVLYTARTFASLGASTNGAFVYCSDCTFANPCVGSGTGAFAKRLNGAWRCD